MWKQFENTDCPTKLRGSPRYSDRLSHTHTAPHQPKLKPSCRFVFRVDNAGTASTGKATMSSDSSEPLQFDIEVSATEGNREAATVAKSPPPCPAGALEISVMNDASGVQNPGLEFFSDLLNANTIPAQPLEHEGTDTGGASKEPGCLSEIWYGAPPPPVSVVEACDEATRSEDDAERCGPDVRGDAECAWTGAAGDSDADADPGEGSMPPAPSCISRCSKHGAHLRVYCADDGQVMCVRCQISMRHNGHRILSDVEAAETMQASHHDWLEKLTKRKEGNMQMIEAIKKTSTEAAEEAERAKRRAGVQYQALISLLEDERTHVLRLIGERQLERRRRHELLMLAIARETQGLQSAIDSLHAAVTAEALPHQTLQAFKAIQESLKGAEKEPPDITQNPNNGLQAVFESEAKISKLLKAFEPNGAPQPGDLCGRRGGAVRAEAPRRARGTGPLPLYPQRAGVPWPARPHPPWLLLLGGGRRWQDRLDGGHGVRIGATRRLQPAGPQLRLVGAGAAQRRLHGVARRRGRTAAGARRTQAHRRWRAARREGGDAGVLRRRQHGPAPRVPRPLPRAALPGAQPAQLSGAAQHGAPEAGGTGPRAILRFRRHRHYRRRHEAIVQACAVWPF
ncbi:uncharacterized protein LOC144717574 isoform X2 [Lampetra planeri]